MKTYDLCGASESSPLRPNASQPRLRPFRESNPLQRCNGGEYADDRFPEDTQQVDILLGVALEFDARIREAAQICERLVRALAGDRSSDKKSSRSNRCFARSGTLHSPSSTNATSTSFPPTSGRKLSASQRFCSPADPYQTTSTACQAVPLRMRKNHLL